MSTSPPLPGSDSETEETYFCRGCEKEITDQEGIELAGFRWHIRCYRCSTCGKYLLEDGSNASLLQSGSLICDICCAYGCSACGNKTEDSVIPTGRIGYCGRCLKCLNCKKKIKNLLYASRMKNMRCQDCFDALDEYQTRPMFQTSPPRLPFLQQHESDDDCSTRSEAPTSLSHIEPQPSAVNQGILGTNESLELLSQDSTPKIARSTKAKLPELATGLLPTSSENTDDGLATVSRTEDRLVSDSGYATGEHHTSKCSGPNLVVRTSESIVDKAQSEGSIVGTIYSAFSTSGLSPTEIYINELATALLDAIKPLGKDRIMLERVHKQLPDLLAAFALRLGYSPDAPLKYQTSAFVYKHRRRVQQVFAEITLPDDVPDEVNSIVEPHEPKDQFVIQRYLEDLEPPCLDSDAPSSPIVEEDDALPTHQQPVSELIPEIHPYRKLLLESPAFAWLLGNVRREALLTRSSPNIMEQIRGEISRAFSLPHKISRRTPSVMHQVTLRAFWDLPAFISEQQFPTNDHNAFKHAVTLTGTPTNAQALTTIDYMEQTWPATGRQILHLLTSIVCLNCSQYSKCDRKTPVLSNIIVLLPDGAKVVMHYDGELIINVEGTVDTIVEITQQIAWLGVALRSSPNRTQMTTCTPYVRSKNIAPTNETPIRSFSIDYLIRIISETNTLNGQCWQHMFGNPVLALGFPVRSRSCFTMGLEMPLNIIPLFAGSNRVTHFNGRTYIKGFAAMLVATALIHDMLVWHFIRHEENEFISYLDYRGLKLSVSFQRLESARHIIGWCSDCEYRAGAPDADYNVHGSRLPPPHAGCLLEKLTVSGGQCITVAASVVLGVRDIGLHLKREGYIDTLSTIGTRYIVLWDEFAKRGWLVNGASALLHLVRAWLHSKSSHVDKELFDVDQIKNGPCTSNGALEVLINSQNRQLPLYIDRTERFDEVVIDKNGQSSIVQKEKRSYYLFEDLVRRFASILEQIFAHQEQAGGKRGVELKCRVRKHLEGWDFAELFSSRDPTPRVATLQALGYGWVDFIRTINAVTLFGSNFGDILRPTGEQSVCQSWKSLPPHRYYLAASISDLKEIVHWYGIPGTRTQLVDGLLWHAPQEFRCICARNESRGTSIRCDPVQALYPRQSKIAITQHSPQAMLSDKRLEGGAVIFGHNIVFPYRWKHRGQDGLEFGSPDTLSPSQNESLEEQVSTELSADTRSDESTGISLSPLPTISTPLESHESRPSDQPRSSNASSHSPIPTSSSSVEQPKQHRAQQTRTNADHRSVPGAPAKAAQPLPAPAFGSKIRKLFARKTRPVVTKH